MYPNEVDTFPTGLKGETIEADHINLLQNAVTAIESYVAGKPVTPCS